MKEKRDSLAYRTFYAYKRAAKKRNIVWKILFEDFVIIVKKDCYICGSQPSNVMKRKDLNNGITKFLYNGLDRVDNNKGYTMNNVRPCCIKCNQIKSNKSLKDILLHISKMIHGLVKSVQL